MNYVFFIESVSANDWPVGEIIHHTLMSEYSKEDISFHLHYITSLKSLQKIISTIERLNDGASIIIHIDAHSDSNYLTFKDNKSPNKSDYTEYHEWDKVYHEFTQLYEKFNNQVLIIFASCHSSSFFESLCSPHIRVIAAEGLTSPHRVEEQMLTFYRDYCKNKNFNHAYKEMHIKYPLGDECKRDKDKAILKYYE